MKKKVLPETTFSIYRTCLTNKEITERPMIWLYYFDLDAKIRSGLSRKALKFSRSVIAYFHLLLYFPSLSSCDLYVVLCNILPIFSVIFPTQSLRVSESIFPSETGFFAARFFGPFYRIKLLFVYCAVVFSFSLSVFENRKKVTESHKSENDEQLLCYPSMRAISAFRSPACRAVNAPN